MGVASLCWCLGVLLMFPNLDARNVKLVPAGTKTVTTNGATHEITRYIVVPDDQTSGPSADTITEENIQHQVTNEDLNESEKNTKEPADVNFKVTSETIIETEKDNKTKAPDVVKYHLVLRDHPDDINHQTDHEITANALDNLIKFKNDAQDTEHTKVDMKVMPLHQESEINLYLKGQNSEEKEHSNLSNDALKLYHQQMGRLADTANKAVPELNEHGDSSKTETESNEKTGDQTSSEKTEGDRNSWRLTKTVYNPAKLTNINLGELLKKWEYAKSVGNETGNHPLLETIGINKTFTLPGKRGRFKLIYEDDDDYNDDKDNVLKKTMLKHNTSKRIAQSKIRYHNNEHFVDTSRKIIPKNDNLSLGLIKIKTSDQNDEMTIRPVLEKTNFDNNIEIGSANGSVELTLDKSNRIINPSLANVSQNTFKVIPLEHNTGVKNSSQIAGNNTVNTTNTKTTIVTQNTYIVPSTDNGINISLFENQNKVVTRIPDTHNNKESITGRTNTNTTIISKFENKNVSKIGSTLAKIIRDNNVPKLEENRFEESTQNQDIDAKRVVKLNTKSGSVILEVVSSSLPINKNVVKTSKAHNFSDPQNNMKITSEADDTYTNKAPKIEKKINVNEGHIQDKGNSDAKKNDEPDTKLEPENFQIISSSSQKHKNDAQVNITDDNTPNFKHKIIIISEVDDANTNMAPKAENNYNSNKTNSIIVVPNTDNVLESQNVDLSTQTIYKNQDIEPFKEIKLEKQNKIGEVLDTNPGTKLGPNKFVVSSNSTMKNKVQTNKINNLPNSLHKITIISDVDDAYINNAPKTEKNLSVKKVHYVDLSTQPISENKDFELKNHEKLIETEARENAKPDTKSEPKTVEVISSSSPKRKNEVQSNITDSSQHKIIISKVDDALRNIAPKIENNLNLKEGYNQDKASAIIAAEPNTDNVLKPDHVDLSTHLVSAKISTDLEPSVGLKGENQINIHAKENAKLDTKSGPKNVEVSSSFSPNHKNSDQSNITDTSPSFKHKFIIISEVDDANTNIAPETKNNLSIKKVNFQEKPNTLRDKPNINNVLKSLDIDYNTQNKPKYNKNLKPSQANSFSFLPQNKLEPTLELDASTNFSPNTNTKSDGIQLTLDETIKLTDDHEYFRNNKKPTNKIILPLNHMLETDTDVNYKQGTSNTNLLPTEATVTPKNETENNPIDSEQFKNVSESKIMTSDSDQDSSDSIEYEDLPLLKTEMNSVYEDNPNEENDRRPNLLNYREEITNNQPESSDNNVKIYPNAHPLSNQQYHNSPSSITTNYPVHPYSYIRNNLYQNGYDSHSNDAYLSWFRNTDVIDNQHLIYILKYMLNLIVDLNQQYANAGQRVDRNAIRMAFIIKHLQNLGIHKLSPEQLQFLTQQIQDHETVDTNKNTNHEIEIIYDIDDNKPNVIAPSNQVVVPNSYYYTPYNNLYPGVAENQNLRLLHDNVYLQHYLLEGFDLDSVNNAIGELGTRILNIVTYLKSLVPYAEIIHFIVEAKKYLSTEAHKSVLSECQNRAYVGMGRRIDMIAKQVLQRSKPSDLRYWYQYPSSRYY